MYIYFAITFSRREKSLSILSFPSCSFLSSASFCLLMSSFMRSRPWLVLLLLLLFTLLLTHCGTWPWCVLTDGGNEDRGGNRWPLPQYLIHEDKPRPSASSGLAAGPLSCPWIFTILRQWKSIMSAIFSKSI